MLPDDLYTYLITEQEALIINAMRDEMADYLIMYESICARSPVPIDFVCPDCGQPFEPVKYLRIDK